MQQPSAQGIASLYRGNPQPLQQGIQKDQQAKPGLPPDLQKMLALQIVTNEQDAVAKQQAMQQLQQMSGGAGKPPTVLQGLQEQARQKMAQQQTAAQQQQQGLQGLMQAQRGGPAPAGVPQPEAQPQGLDQLPVEFGMAGGGIVAFAGGGTSEYETRYDKMNRENRERDEKEAAQAAELEALVAQIPTGGPTVRGGERVDSTELSRNVQNALSALPGASAARAVGGGAGSIRGVLAGLAGLMGRGEESTPVAQSAVPAQAQAPRDNRALLNAADAGQRAQPAATAAPIRDLKGLADQATARQGVRAPAQSTTPTNAPEAESSAMRLVKNRMGEDAGAARSAEQALRLKELGAPDTSVYDRTLAELEKRKAQLEGPKDQWGQLMEYLGQVGAGGRGRTWMEAGAQGGAGVDKLKKERALQQFDLSKQALEVSQKKLDTVRAFAQDQYNVGKTTFDRVYKDQFDAAKEVVKDESAARQLAQQNTLKMLEMQNQLKVANINASSRAAGDGGGDKQQLAELKALQKQYVDQMKTTFNKADKSALQAKLNTVESAIYKLAGLDTMAAAPGAPSPGGTRPPLSSFQR